jgi:transposase
MSETTCPGCLERDAVITTLLQRVQELEGRVRELEGRLGQNASNSSVPPSANPPSAPKPVVKKRSGRSTGGQPGHPGHQRQRLPRERVDHLIPLIPDRCACCQAPLPQQPSPGDPEPVWHQFAELPPVAAVVTEFQGHARTCQACGHVTCEAIPAEIRAHAFGPRLAAVVSYLGGCQHVSQRGLEDVVETVFGVPISLGSVDTLQGQMSQALEAPHQEIAQEVRQAAAKNVDETGWKEGGQKRWLWAAVTATAALFLIHARRGAVGLRALLGETIVGLITSDRWSAYLAVALEWRQICWAHLRRDFQGMVDRGGAGEEVGRGLLEQTRVLFGLWYKVRDGTRSRAWLARQLERRVRPEVRALLEQGAACGCAKTAGMCAEILKVEAALWTFAHHEGVEPTNNAAERALRPAVVWRKKSYGCHSEEGCRFVERLLSVTATLRLRGQPVLEYLVEALDAHRSGLPIPQLLPNR